jgi:GT2 family glycosyltransferase
MSVLAVVPVHLRAPLDGELLARCLVSLWHTAPDARVVVVDDASPARGIVAQLDAIVDELGQELVRSKRRLGEAAAVNVGLARAREEGADALIVSPQLQFLERGWLEALLATDGLVAGGRLLAPSGLIHGAGLFFSELTRTWEHRFAFAPADLPEALVPARCPVPGDLQLIRHAALQAVGLYDEGYRGRYGDVDYCLRAQDCVYAPDATAITFAAPKAGVPTNAQQAKSLGRLLGAHTDLRPYIPAAP